MRRTFLIPLGLSSGIIIRGSGIEDRMSGALFARRIGINVIFVAFFFYAIAYNVIGTLVTDVMETTGMDLSHVGFLMSAIQVGILIAICSSMLFLRRFSRTAIIRTGMLFIVIGLFMILLLPYEWSLYLAFIVFGFGGFCMDSGSNSYLSSSPDSDSRRNVPLIHFVYSTGALLSGYIMIPFRNLSWRIGYAAFGLAMLIVLISSFAGSAQREEEKSRGAESKPVPILSIVSNPSFIALTISLMLYMTAQQIGSNWYPYYIETTFKASDAIAAAAMMSFWVGIAAMRFLSSILLSKGLSPILLSAIGLAVSGIGQVLAALSGNATMALVFIAFSGFAAGANIPCYIVEVSSWYPGNTFFVSTLYLLSGTIGRMVMQPIAAFAVDRIGPGSMLLLFSSFLFVGALLTLYVMLRRKRSRL